MFNAQFSMFKEFSGTDFIVFFVVIYFSARQFAIWNSRNSYHICSERNTVK